MQNLVLFVNGNPVGYTVYEREASYLLSPTLFNADISAPSIKAKFEDGNWNIQPCSDRDLTAQVVEDMNQYVLKSASNY